MSWHAQAAIHGAECAQSQAHPPLVKPCAKLHSSAVAGRCKITGWTDRDHGMKSFLQARIALQSLPDLRDFVQQCRKPVQGSDRICCAICAALRPARITSGAADGRSRRRTRVAGGKIGGVRPWFQHSTGARRTYGQKVVFVFMHVWGGIIAQVIFSGVMEGPLLPAAGIGKPGISTCVPPILSRMRPKPERAWRAQALTLS